jgi:antitoxin MazE
MRPYDGRLFVERLYTIAVIASAIMDIASMEGIMRIAIRRVGDETGIIIPDELLAELGLEGQAEADVFVRDGALVVCAPSKPVRSGWAEASKVVAAAGDDALVLPEFANEDDAELKW